MSIYWKRIQAYTKKVLIQWSSSKFATQIIIPPLLDNRTYFWASLLDAVRYFLITHRKFRLSWSYNHIIFIFAEFFGSCPGFRFGAPRIRSQLIFIDVVVFRFELSTWLSKSAVHLLFVSVDIPLQSFGSLCFLSNLFALLSPKKHSKKKSFNSTWW